MGYWLGIDVGSTFTAAAVCRDGGPAEAVALSGEGAVIPSVVYLGEAGEVLVGQAALHRARTDPDRVVRAFTQRIGDEVPMLIGGQARTAAQIAATLIRWVIERVAAQQAGPASGIVLTHPAGWGTYKIELLAHALQAAGLPAVHFATEPEAAAGSTASAHFPPGNTIAIYDLGGATFNTAVGRTTSNPGGFTLLGQPHRLDALGGADFDDAVFTHVLTAVPALADLDPDDPATLIATAALRQACTHAKEALSADTETTIPVLAPGISTHVRLHRAEFEDLIRPQVEETVQTLRRAVQSAQLDPSELDVVVLVGGSSRVPLVTQLVSAELGRPVAVDTDPRTAIALGAARCARLGAAGTDLATDPSADGKHDEPIAPEIAVPAAAQAPQRPTLTSIPLQVNAVPQSPRGVKRLALVASLTLLTTAAATVPFLPVRSAAAPQPVAAKPPTTNPAAAPVSEGNHSTPSAPASQAVTPLPAITSATPVSGTARARAIPVRSASSRTTATPVSDSAVISSVPTGSGGAPPVPESGTIPAPPAASTPSPTGAGSSATPSGSGASSAPAPSGGSPSAPSGGSAPTGGSTSTAPDPGDATKPAPTGGGTTGTTSGSSPTTPGTTGSTPSPSSGGTSSPPGTGSSTQPSGQSGGTSSGPPGTSSAPSTSTSTPPAKST